MDSVYWTTLTTNLTVDRESHTEYWPPAKVMRTAAMPKNKSVNAAIEFHINVESVHERYYLYTHIAELQELREDQYRAMNIKVNGELLHGPVVPRYLSSDTFYSAKGFTGEMVYVFTIEPFHNSTLPPILNAVEIYKELEFLQSETNEDEGRYNMFITNYDLRERFYDIIIFTHKYLFFFYYYLYVYSFGLSFSMYQHYQ